MHHYKMSSLLTELNAPYGLRSPRGNGHPSWWWWGPMHPVPLLPHQTTIYIIINGGQPVLQVSNMCFG